MNLPTKNTMKLVLLMLAAGTLGVGGCVKQNTYDNLYEANKALTAQNQSLSDDNKSLRDAIEDLRRRSSNSSMSASEASQTIVSLQSENDRLKKLLADYDAKLAGLAAGPLDQATDAALQDLAAKYPDVLSYDSARGMLRFNSDVTFASGSFEITSQAKSTIDALAKILKELPSAQQYDVKVVGHTDSQPVSGRAARPFKNNVELSAFRSISVRTALVEQGLAANRVEFAGFGEFRPAVQNNASGNTPQNRRVEVFLTKSTLVTGSLGMPASIARKAAVVAPATKPVATTTTTPEKPAATPPTKPVKPANNDDIMK